MPDGCESYLDEHFEMFLAELQQWLAIPSISTLAEHSRDVDEAARWVSAKMESIGLQDVGIIPTEGHPLVYGEWQGKPEQPTLLFYGHYDVQPVDPVKEWHSPPFSPEIRDGAIYCRGASDDKSQILLVLAALQAWMESTGQLPVNVKVLLEGEEEAGGDSIDAYVRKHPEKLAADAVLICDTHMVDEDQPSLIIGLRGILYTEIEVRGAATDLHSGSYGGVAPNPLHALCVLFSRLKGEDGKINISGLYEAEEPVQEVERNFWREDPLNLTTSLQEEMGVDCLVGDSAYPPLERLGVRPTLELHGIRGGFTGDGAKTVIPATATAKVSLRIPAVLDPQDVFAMFEKAVHDCLPAGHTAVVTNLHRGRGISVNPENRYVSAAAQALRKTYGKDPVFMREGGSIPIAALFDAILGVPVVLMGFGLPDDGAHAPNEKFSLSQLRQGMKTVADFLERIQAGGNGR